MDSRGWIGIKEQKLYEPRIIYHIYSIGREVILGDQLATDLN